MKYIIRMCVILICLLPVISLGYDGLIPCSGVATSTTDSSLTPCTYESLIALGNKIINFCIVTGTSIFALIFMYAGFLYLTANGDTAQISKAHGFFWNAIVGFVIMLSAWLIVDFILTNLISSSKITNYRLLGK